MSNWCRRIDPSTTFHAIPDTDFQALPTKVFRDISGLLPPKWTSRTRAITDKGSTLSISVVTHEVNDKNI
jgi:hypothetical protein